MEPMSDDLSTLAGKNNSSPGHEHKGKTRESTSGKRPDAKMGSKHEFFLEPRNTAVNDAIRKDMHSYHSFKEKKLLLEMPANTILHTKEGFIYPLEDGREGNVLDSTMARFKALSNAENSRKDASLMTQAELAIDSSELWELQRRRNEVKAKLREHEISMSLNPNVREHALRDLKTDFPAIQWGPPRMSAKQRISSIPFIPRIDPKKKK